MKTARKPTPEQADLIQKAGLDPQAWSVRFEDDRYLHLVDRGLEQREIVIVDKETAKTVKSPAV